MRNLRRNKGFTMVELIVSIGIIVLLISILLPAVNTARRKGKSVQCQANLRSLEQAFAAYCQENNGRSMAYMLPPSGWQPTGTQQINGYSNFWFPLLKANGLTASTLVCPEASDPSPTQVGSASLGWGGPGNTYPRIGTNVGGYGINGWLYEAGNTTLPQPSASGGSNATPGFAYWHLPISGDNSQIPVFADSVWVEGWPQAGDTPEADTRAGPGATVATMPPPNIATNYMQEFCINRHVERRVNVVFLDGHADSFELPELWSAMALSSSGAGVGATAMIRWYPQYAPPTAPPAVP